MSQVRPLLSPLLVGRDEVLALADRRIAEASAGRGTLLVLAGQGGIGKTRMLDTTRRKAKSAGFRICGGDLGPHDRQVPLASILDMARSMRAQAFGSLGQELLELEGRRGGDSLGARRALVHDIADRILLAIDRPTVLSFDDLQWADELSLEVIGELARLGRRLPLLLLAAYRLDELPPASVHREWRARLLSQRLAEEARLTPLTLDETALVVTLILGTGLPAPREVVSAVYERTDGIPLHIEELLAALDDEARGDGRAIREAHVPDTIEDAVLARASRLTDDAREVARAGAVIGRCFTPEVLAGCLDRPVADLDAPLAELVEQAFLFPFDFLDRGFYDFRHALLRDALYATVPATELRRLHARAGEFGSLISNGSTIHASVHYERAGLRPQAFRAALTGARAARAVSSRREAFELYRRAVANIPAELPERELGDLYAEYSEAASAIDDAATTLSSSAAARTSYLGAGMPIEAAMRLMYDAGIARRELRPLDERRAMIDSAWAEVESLPASPGRAEVEINRYALRGVAAVDAMDLEEARAMFAACRRIAAEWGDEESIADAEFFLAQVDVVAGRVDDGIAESLAIARKARDAGSEGTSVTAYRNVGILGVRAMRYEIAAVAIAEGLRYADSVQQSYCRHMMAATSGLVSWARGDWDEAVRVAGQELVEPGSPRAVLEARDARALVALGRGDVDRARQLLAESLAAGRETGEVALVLPALWGLAETALVAGEPARAVEASQEALELALATGERALLVPFAVTGLRARLAVRQPHAAERWLEQVAAHLSSWDTAARPALDHADGLLRTSTGSTIAARSALEAAVAGWDGLGRTWEALWARLDLAACLLRANRENEAVPVVRDVIARAEEIGSPPLRRRAEELLAVARGRGGEEEPWRPLTAREFEVARLVADGMTNIAIGERLGLSPRTVGAHVEHILAKLGATRRAEIAAWVASMASATELGVAG